MSCLQLIWIVFRRWLSFIGVCNCVLQREPALQVIRYSGQAIPLLPNGISNPLLLLRSFKWALVVEASIESKAECIALVCCVATNGHEYPNVKVEVWRGGRLVVESTLSQYSTSRDPSLVQLWTMRREHLIVQSLQLVDRICIHMIVYRSGCTMVEGAVCIVHREDENLVLAVNSEVLSKSQSEGLAKQFGQLVLEGKDEQLVL
jgi:hypothetical protein